MMMLERDWETAAQPLLDWLATGVDMLQHADRRDAHER